MDTSCTVHTYTFTGT